MGRQEFIKQGASADRRGRWLSLRPDALFFLLMALVLFIGVPFKLGLRCSCCSTTGQTCAVISCSGCCGAHGGQFSDYQSPEMIPEAVPALLSPPATYGHPVTLPAPETVYVDLPERPPNLS